MDSPRGGNIEDPHNVALNHPGGVNDEGEQPVGKQSLYKRVKAKAKRMKESFKGQGGHGNDLDEDVDDDVDDLDTDNDVHAAPGKEGITSQHGTNIKERAVIGDLAPVNNPDDIGTPLGSENQSNELKDTPVIDHSTGSHSTDKGIQLGSENQHNELRNTPVTDHSAGSHSTDQGIQLDSENQPNVLNNTPVIGQSTGSQSTGGLGVVRKPKLGGYLEKEPLVEEDGHTANDQAEVDEVTPEGYGSTTTQDIGLGQEGITPRQDEDTFGEGAKMDGTSNTPESKPVEYQTFDTTTSVYIPGEEERLGRSRTDTGGSKLSEEQPYVPENTSVLDRRGHYHTGAPEWGETGESGKHVDKLSILEKDSHASKDVGEKLHAENYQTKVTDPTGRGAEDIESSPILHELGKMNIHDESTQKLDPYVKTGQQEHQYIPTGNHDQFSQEAVTEPQFDATIPISQGFHDEEEQKPESYSDKISSEIPTNELGKMNIQDESTQKFDPDVKTGQQEHQNISAGNHDQFQEAIAKPQFDATIPISQGFDDEEDQIPESYNDKLSRETPTNADSIASFNQQPDQEPLKKPVAGGYGETISNFSSSITNTAGLAKDAVASKLGYGETKEESGPEYQVRSTGDSPNKGLSVKEDEFSSKVINEPLDKKPVEGGYGETVSSISSSITNTAGLAKDAVASKLGYGATQEESGPEYQVGSTDGSSDKGVSVKEDKALSKVINEALPLHEAKEGNPIDEGTNMEKEERGTELGKEKKVVVKGKVTESEEVANLLGKAEDTSFDEAGSGLASPGKTVMDRLRDAAGSWFNKSGGEPHVESPVQLGDHIEEGNDRVTQTGAIEETQLNQNKGETGLY